MSYTWRHSFWLLVLTYNWYLPSLQSFQHIHGSDLIIYLHTHIPLAITPALLLTWHPPVVTGIVHLGPRLSVNCSPSFPIVPLCPPLQNPNPFSDFPDPNVHLIRRVSTPFPASRTIKGIVSRDEKWNLNTLHFAISCLSTQMAAPLGIQVGNKVWCGKKIYIWKKLLLNVEWPKGRKTERRMAKCRITEGRKWITEEWLKVENDRRVQLKTSKGRMTECRKDWM